jgi:type IV pilus assembly protein PilE
MICPRHRGGSRGFTLIELIIAVAIGGILVALALPSFLGSIKKGRRSEAVSSLTNLQQEQERWRSNNQTYTESLANLRMTSPSSPGQYYTLAVTAGTATATGYEAVADGSSSTQSSDGECAKLAVKVDRSSITYASCSTCTSFTFAASNLCWSR